MKIKILLTKKEFLSDFIFKDKMETEENRKYLKENFENIIQCETEHLLDSISELGHRHANVINDNRGEICVQNDDTDEELGSIGFYSDVTL